MMTMTSTVQLWALTGPHAGESVERAPIDAREMLATGGWSLTPPGADPVTAMVPADAPEDPLDTQPANITRAFDAAPAKPAVLPTGRTKRG